MTPDPLRKPPWLKKKLPRAEALADMTRLLRGHGLHTVCERAACPNRGECFERGTATFLILGDHCTRNCRFCAVPPGHPGPPDPEEPHRVAHAAVSLGLRHVVITSVTRDDLSDGGASHFVACMQAVRRALAQGCGLRGLSVEDYAAISPAFGDDITSVLDFAASVARHDVTGGTAPAAVAEQLRRARERLRD